MLIIFCKSEAIQFKKYGKLLHLMGHNVWLGAHNITNYRAILVFMIILLFLLSHPHNREHCGLVVEQGTWKGEAMGSNLAGVPCCVFEQDRFTL